jgi:hypothetical protein
MSDGRARGWRELLGKALVRGSLLGTVLFIFCLIADQEIAAAAGAEYDDTFFLLKADCWYWFDEGYSLLSFIKEPTYPLFVAVCYRLGLPLRMAHEALYLAAAGFLAWSLVHRQTRAGIGLMVFVAIALHPMHFAVFQSATHDSIYSSLLMLALGALLLQFKQRGEPGRLWRWLRSGVALGLLWNTRAEHLLVLVPVGVFVAAGAFSEWRRRSTLALAIRAWLVEWSPPVAIVAAITLAIMGANYARWGVFAVSDWDAPNLNAACRALLSIKPDHPLPSTNITREVRERAYTVSPSFRELAPFLDGDGDIAQSWGRLGRDYYDAPPGEYCFGFNIVVLPMAATVAGHGSSARELEAYFGRVAEEIRIAAAAGQLATRWIPPGLGWALHPDIQTYASNLVPSWRSLWWWCWSAKVPGEVTPDDSVEPEIRALYDRVARRRSFHNQGYVTRAGIRDRISAAYVWIMEMALAASCLVAAGVLLSPGAATAGWAAYLLPAAAFGLYGFARLEILTLLDASLFSVAGAYRYLFPAPLLLTIMAVWLLAEGLRLLSVTLPRTKTRSNRQTWVQRLAGYCWVLPPEVPFANRPKGSTPARNRVRILLGFLLFVASLLLLLQMGYNLVRVPDRAKVQIALDASSEEEITGWARLLSDPDSSIHVEIYDDTTLLSTVLADEFRQDLLDYGVGDGRHGFRYRISSSLKDGNPHTIKIRIPGTYLECTTTVTINKS